MMAADDVKARLGELADPARAAQEKRYLKSDLRHLGVGLPALRKVAITAAAGLDREQTLTLVEELWHPPVHDAWVTAWVRDHLTVVSGVTIREAVRHLPDKDREDLLAAYRTR